jgi:hypothetical protein
LSVKAVLLNFAAFQVGWSCCVLGAAGGRSWLGPAVVVVLVALHLTFRPHARREARLLLFVGVIGTLIDSAFAVTGTVSYGGNHGVSWMAPLWISALWVNFGTTIRVSLRWLQDRPGLAALLGAFAGPLAYYAAFRLGAVHLPHPAWSLVLLGLAWAAVVPALFQLSRREPFAIHPS